MTDSTTNPLAAYGDRLERAAARDLGRRRRHLVPPRVALALAATLILGAGTVAASGLLTPKQVAAGMPAGAAIFENTRPTCVAAADGTSYRCTLDTSPAPESSDFTGVKEVLTVDGVVSGGCEGQDVAGMSWICYVGQAAVDHEIIGPDLLGEDAPEPGHG